MSRECPKPRFSKVHFLRDAVQYVVTVQFLLLFYGQIVQVKVLEVEVARKRISLTMKLDETAKAKHTEHNRRSSRGKKKQSQPPSNSAFADILSKALK